MGSLSDPSAIVDERYRAERAALPAPRGRFAYARYWLGRLRVELLFKWLANASIWLAGRPGSKGQVQSQD